MTGHARTRSVLGIAGLVPAVLLLLWAAAAPAQVPESRQQISLSFAPLVAETAPAVVNIYTSRVVRTRQRSPLFDDPFFRRFFGQRLPGGPTRRRQQSSLGSGVIIGEQGLVVTNHHVIEGADEITVVLSDRNEYPAALVVSDPGTDLALLEVGRLEGRRLPTLPLGNSDDLLVGDLVMAIGNPFGVGQTVTTGIVSALARSSVGLSDFSFFIQTDAAINPGNSGGALVSLDGRLIGINTAIFSRDGGSLGIGFAVPSNMVRTLIEGVERGTPLAKPWFGATGPGVDPEAAEALDLPRPTGVLVERLFPDSPADRAGVRVGDVVWAINGFEVENDNALRFRVATLPVDQRADVTVFRQGRFRTLDFAVAFPPDDPPRSVTALTGGHALAGATVANLNPQLIAEIGFDGPDTEGVVVLEVARRSPAARVGFDPGDVILELNGRAIDDVRDLTRRLDQPLPWRLRIRRGGRVLDTVVRG